jgi:hypothetical protein
MLSMGARVRRRGNQLNYLLHQHKAIFVPVWGLAKKWQNTGNVWRYLAANGLYNGLMVKRFLGSWLDQRMADGIRPKAYQRRKQNNRSLKNQLNQNIDVHP